MPQSGQTNPNRKTRTGCLRCKQRKIKCDETHPHCSQCTRKGYDCPGYKRPLKWSSKHEVASGNEGKWKSAQAHANSGIMADRSNLCASQKGASTGDVVDGSLHWPGLEVPLLLPLSEDQGTILSRHYFSLVCHINSCFDSDTNIFRVEVRNMMDSCPLIHHAILSMSAAHLAPKQSDLVTAALNHKTQAISCLKLEVMKMCGEQSSFDVSTEVLLGSILLGITEGWHNPSHLGIMHLHGARGLFKSWISEIQNFTHEPLVLACSSRIRSFMVGAMAYWESIASFVMDQPLYAITYLGPFCDQGKLDQIYPNPWTGICTPLFIYLARAGTLGKQQSSLKRLHNTRPGVEIQDPLQQVLFEQARETEKTVLHYKIPAEDRIEDTNDQLTPLHHLHKVARIYRLVTLLELYRAFPRLLEGFSEETPEAAPHVSSIDKLLTIATSGLTLISAIPHSSGVNALLIIPLTIAGSTLQPTTKLSDTIPSQTSWDMLSTETLSISSQEDICLDWRDFVRERIKFIYSYVGVVTVCRALEILDKVWARADIKSVLDGPGSMATAADLVQWPEVMEDERLETLLG